MYIAVCDDQIEELEAVTGLLRLWQEKHQTMLRFKTFRSATELLAASEKTRFDLYLLDVMMPGTDGLAAAREIRELDDTAEIVFVTSSPGFAYESYSVHAMDYLLKPVQGEQLFSVLNRMALRERNPQDGLTLKCGSMLTRVPFSSLTFVEVNGKHLYFNLADGTVREVFGTLHEYEPLLLARPEFLRIHRSYIANMMQVEEMSLSGVVTFSGKSLPVSRRLYPDVQKAYMKLLFADREVKE